ncbi:nuclear envelope phosphatase-regulatory subunit 1 [Brachionus plicatilis]|uniref:Transmembrane protein 188 n=1 Tax=Brachionus plicatilis TaxID=10195 RepID=A0A3M7SQ20_BRAPC|nr:nuclear envelope phosphatase-regulatory subunit 1 [Brachionus plicatilis]
MDNTSAEDLRLFEKRLTEVVAHLQPSMWRYRILLVILIILSIFGAWSWLSDPHTAKLPIYESLLDHLLFTISFSTLIILFFFGIHKKIVSSSV